MGWWQCKCSVRVAWHSNRHFCTPWDKRKVSNGIPVCVCVCLCVWVYECVYVTELNTWSQHTAGALQSLRARQTECVCVYVCFWTSACLCVSVWIKVGKQVHVKSASLQCVTTECKIGFFTSLLPHSGPQRPLEAPDLQLEQQPPLRQPHILGRRLGAYLFLWRLGQRVHR
jgi:hypothetical protein